MKAADISVNVNGEVVKDRIFTRMSLLDLYVTELASPELIPAASMGFVEHAL